MRLITFVCITVFLSGCIGSKNSATSSGKLNGTWGAIRAEMNGKALPTYAYATQKLILNDSTYTVIAESIDKGTVRYKKGKMDIYGKDGINAGKHFTAIYKYKNDELTICYNLKGDSYPDAFETKDNPKFFLSVFKKEAK